MLTDFAELLKKGWRIAYVATPEYSPENEVVTLHRDRTERKIKSFGGLFNPKTGTFDMKELKTNSEDCPIWFRTYNDSLLELVASLTKRIDYLESIHPK